MTNISLTPFDNTGNCPIIAPGLNDVPVDIELDHANRFSDGADLSSLRGAWTQRPRLTRREVAMLQLMNEVTDQPAWQQRDATKEQLNGIECISEQPTKPLVSKHVLEWCRKEMTDTATFFHEKRFILAIDSGSRVAKSDVLVPPDLRAQLETVARKILDQTESRSGAIELVDSAFVPLVFGETPVFVNGGDAPAQVVPEPKTIWPKNDSTTQKYLADLWSKRFQRLPCDIKFVSNSSTAVQITSPVAGLPSRLDEVLRQPLETLISLSIEPLNHILILNNRPRSPVRIKTYGAAENDGWDPEPGISFSYEDWKCGRTGKPLLVPSDVELEGTEWLQNHEHYSVCLQDIFRETGLQGFVSMKTIELSPENPSWKQQNWRTQGLLNEHVVATVLYSFEVDNVNGGELHFRQDTQLPTDGEDFHPMRHDALARIFGIGDTSDRYPTEPAFQEIGTVTLSSGRFIAFPNTLQWRQADLSLEDQSREGRLSYMMIELVDPHYRLCSTRNVPADEFEWSSDEKRFSSRRLRLEEFKEEMERAYKVAREGYHSHWYY